MSSGLAARAINGRYRAKGQLNLQVELGSIRRMQNARFTCSRVRKDGPFLGGMARAANGTPRRCASLSMCLIAKKSPTGGCPLEGTKISKSDL